MRLSQSQHCNQQTFFFLLRLAHMQKPDLSWLWFWPEFFPCATFPNQFPCTKRQKISKDMWHKMHLILEQCFTPRWSDFLFGSCHSLRTRASRRRTIVNQFLFGFNIAKLISFLLTIPALVPVIEAKARVVHKASDEKVRTHNGIVNGQTGCCPNIIRKGRELSTLHQNGMNVLIFCNFFSFFDYTRGDLLQVDRISTCNCVKALYILTTNKHIAVGIPIYSHIACHRFMHGRKALAIRTENGNLSVIAQGSMHCWQNGQGWHHNWLRGVVASLRLEPHEKSAVRGNYRDLLLLI